MKQIQAKNRKEWIRVNIDDNSRHHIDRIHKLAEKLLGIRISDSVLIRTAIESLRLDMLQGMFHAVDGADNKADILENASRFCDIMRERMKTVAEGK